MENLINKIQPYIDGELEGEELKNFENELQTDAKLQKELEVYQTIIAAIRAKEEERLRQKFAVMDVVLDKQLEEEEQKKLDNIRPQIRSLSFRKSFVFKAAATVLVTFSAYMLFFWVSQISEPSPLSFDEYDVKYAGWVQTNTLGEAEVTEPYANQDKIDKTSKPTDTNSDVKMPLSAPSQEGVELTNTPKTPSISTKEDNPFANQYEDANFFFLNGNKAMKKYEGRSGYDIAVERLKQIPDTNATRKSFRLGMAYYYNQNWEDAMVSLQNAIKGNNNLLPPTDIATAKWHLAMTYAKKGNIATAKSYFNELANSKNDYTQNAKKVISAMK